MTAMSVVLAMHSLLRWAVVIGLVTVTLRAMVAHRRRRGWQPRDTQIHRIVVATVDLQLLLGLVMYLWLSPLPAAFWADPAAGLKQRALRFFAIEHPLMMLLAVVAVHAGGVLGRRIDGVGRQRRAWVGTVVALGLIVAAIPWPGRHDRPLARGLSPMPDTVTCPTAYGAQCATCHGVGGHGDGPSASGLSPRPRDFAAPRMRTRSDADIASVIREGGAAHGLSPAMPSHPHFGARDLDRLVDCVRSLGAPIPQRRER